MLNLNTNKPGTATTEVQVEPQYNSTNHNQVHLNPTLLIQPAQPDCQTQKRAQKQNVQTLIETNPLREAIEATTITSRQKPGALKVQKYCSPDQRPRDKVYERTHQNKNQIVANAPKIAKTQQPVLQSNNQKPLPLNQVQLKTNKMRATNEQLPTINSISNQKFNPHVTIESLKRQAETHSSSITQPISQTLGAQSSSIISSSRSSELIYSTSSKYKQQDSSESSLFRDGKMLNVPVGDFQNDKDLNPLGLSQKAMEDCMRLQTEIKSRVLHIDEKIKIQNHDQEVYDNPPAHVVLANMPVGPLEPNCVLAEEDFSPFTDLGEITSSVNRDPLNIKKLNIMCDFTTSATNIKSDMQVMPPPSAAGTKKKKAQILTPMSAVNGKQLYISSAPISPTATFNLNLRKTSKNDSGITMPVIVEPVKQLVPVLRADQVAKDEALREFRQEVNFKNQNEFSGSQRENQCLDTVNGVNHDSQGDRLPYQVLANVASRQLDLSSWRQTVDARDSISKQDNFDLIYDQIRHSFTNKRPASLDTSKNIFQNTQKDSVQQPQQQEKNKYVQYLLPEKQPVRKQGKKTLVIDLDETLVHSQFKPVQNSDIAITIDISNIPNQVLNQRVYACKRPFCDEFLKTVAPLYEIVMFTASLARYAEPIFKKLDPKGQLMDHCLYRDHCTQFKRDVYVKDLTRLGRPIESIIILDNSPNSYLYQPQNAFPCTSWYDNKNDNELQQLISVFQKIAKFQGDVRRILRKIIPSPSINIGYRALSQNPQIVDTKKANIVLDRVLKRQTYQVQKQQQLKIQQLATVSEKQSEEKPLSSIIESAVDYELSVSSINRNSRNMNRANLNFSNQNSYSIVKKLAVENLRLQGSESNDQITPNHKHSGKMEGIKLPQNVLQQALNKFNLNVDYSSSSDVDADSNAKKALPGSTRNAQNKQPRPVEQQRHKNRTALPQIPQSKHSDLNSRNSQNEAMRSKLQDLGSKETSKTQQTNQTEVNQSEKQLPKFKQCNYRCVYKSAHLEMPIKTKTVNLNSSTSQNRPTQLNPRANRIPASQSSQTQRQKADSINLANVRNQNDQKRSRVRGGVQKLGKRGELAQKQLQQHASPHNSQEYRKHNFSSNNSLDLEQKISGYQLSLKNEDRERINSGRNEDAKPLSNQSSDDFRKLVESSDQDSQHQAQREAIEVGVGSGPQVRNGSQDRTQQEQLPHQDQGKLSSQPVELPKMLQQKGKSRQYELARKLSLPKLHVELLDSAQNQPNADRLPELRPQWTPSRRGNLNFSHSPNNRDFQTLPLQETLPNQLLKVNQNHLPTAVKHTTENLKPEKDIQRRIQNHLSNSPSGLKDPILLLNLNERWREEAKAKINGRAGQVESLSRNQVLLGDRFQRMRVSSTSGQDLSLPQFSQFNQVQSMQKQSQPELGEANGMSGFLKKIQKSRPKEAIKKTTTITNTKPVHLIPKLKLQALSRIQDLRQTQTQRTDHSKIKLKVKTEPDKMHLSSCKDQLPVSILQQITEQKSLLGGGLLSSISASKSTGVFKPSNALNPVLLQSIDSQAIPSSQQSVRQIKSQRKAEDTKVVIQQTQRQQPQSMKQAVMQILPSVEGLSRGKFQLRNQSMPNAQGAQDSQRQAINKGAPQFDSIKQILASSRCQSSPKLEQSALHAGVAAANDRLQARSEHLTQVPSSFQRNQDTSYILSNKMQQQIQHQKDKRALKIQIQKQKQILHDQLASRTASIVQEHKEPGKSQAPQEMCLMAPELLQKLSLVHKAQNHPETSQILPEALKVNKKIVPSSGKSFINKVTEDYFKAKLQSDPPNKRSFLSQRIKNTNANTQNSQNCTTSQGQISPQRLARKNLELIKRGRNHGMQQVSMSDPISAFNKVKNFGSCQRDWHLGNMFSSGLKTVNQEQMQHLNSNDQSLRSRAPNQIPSPCSTLYLVATKSRQSSAKMVFEESKIQEKGRLRSLDSANTNSVCI